MSKENLVKLIQTAAEDEQLKSRLENASSYQELRSVAQRQGFELGDLSAEQARRTIAVVTGQISEELTDEELELVAGGIVRPCPSISSIRISGTVNILVGGASTDVRRRAS